MLDPDGVVTSWNPGAQRFKGYAGRRDHRPAFLAVLHRGRSHRGAPLQSPGHGRPGRSLRARRLAGPQGRHAVLGACGDRSDPADDGALIGFAKITRDPHQSGGRPEEALRQSEQQFRLLVQGALPTTRSTCWTRADRSPAGTWAPSASRAYAPDEIIGEHFSQFYTEEDRAAGLPGTGWRRPCATGRWETEGWRVRKDGSQFWAHVIIDCIRDDTGAVIGFAKITRDISERRETQQALEQAQQALFQSQKMEAVGAAHRRGRPRLQQPADRDHRRPGHAQAQRARRDGAPHAGAGHVALRRRTRRQPDPRACWRSRAASRCSPTPTELNILVRNMTELLHRTLGEAVELEGVLAPRLWQVEVDQNQLESAILNLAVNARDAMPDGGKLTIATENTHLDASYSATDAEVLPGQYVAVAVSDTGAGMSKEVVARVFEPSTHHQGSRPRHGARPQHGLRLRQAVGAAHVTIYSEPRPGHDGEALPASLHGGWRDRSRTAGVVASRQRGRSGAGGRGQTTMCAPTA